MSDVEPQQYSEQPSEYEYLEEDADDEGEEEDFDYECEEEYDEEGWESYELEEE